MAQKYSLMTLRTTIHHFDIPQMAIRSRTSEDTVRSALLARPVCKEDAESILAVFSEMTGTDYNLGNVKICILADD